MVGHTSTVESEIQAEARRLAAASTPSRVARTRQRLSANAVAMAWATRQPAFKTHLFRFVDVVPACASAAEVATHLREELDRPESPAAVRRGLQLAAAVPGGDALAAAVARSGIRRMARQFIIGEHIDEVVGEIGARWEAGFASTVDLLGEKTLTAADADRYAARVAESLDALIEAARRWPARPHLEQDPFGPIGRVNLSVKPSALAPRLHAVTEALGVAEAVERLAPLLDRARVAGATIHLDAEHDETKDATQALLAEIGRRWPDGPALGCVVQAYRRDAADDLARLVDWSSGVLTTPLQIRLVKGAYWDAETIAARAAGWPNPLYEVKSASDASYELCAAELAAGAARGAVRPAFASHNLRSIAAAVVSCRRAGLDDSAFEVQVLHGMAESLHRGLRDSGLRTRVYSPMGELIPGMGYLVRRLLENTANESFVRQQWSEGADLAAALADPLAAAPRPLAPPTSPPPSPEEDPVSVTAAFRNEPLAEVRRAPVRRRLADATGAVEATLGFDVPVLIDGWAAPGLGGDPLASVDPGRLQRVVARQALASPRQAAEAVEVAHGALDDWGRRSMVERASVLVAAADLLRRRRDELSALIAIEAGKPIAEADADVGEAIDFWTYYASAAVQLDATHLAQVPGERNELRWRPRGVTVVISPWNFPLAIPAGMVGAALVTGNPVVFKPAEQTPGVALRMVEILHQAGVPPAALALLPGLGEVVGPVLVEHPLVATIAFTGSRAVGLDIVRRAAATPDGQRTVKRVSAEMGGKNPVIVDLDADLDVTVPALVSGAFGYAGQKCSATSRVLVPIRLVDQLASRLAGAVEALTIGHPTDPANAMGPVIDADAFDRVHRYRGVAAGEGQLVVQRDDVPDGGWYVGPTVVIVDDPHAKVASDEIFGPLLAIVPVADFDEALAVANDSDYALTAGLFSRTPSHIDEAARRLDAGNLYVNRATTGAMVARQPFGGHKLSGSGAKTGGPGYLEQFATPVVITENTQRQGFAPELL